MDDEFPELDQLLERAHRSALRSLNAAADIEQRLRAVHQASDSTGTTDKTLRRNADQTRLL